MTRDQLMQMAVRAGDEARRLFGPQPWESLRALGKAQGILAVINIDDSAGGQKFIAMDVMTLGRELDSLQSKLALRMQ